MMKVIKKKLGETAGIHILTYIFLQNCISC